MSKADYITTFGLGLIIFGGVFFFTEIICSPFTWYAVKSQKERFESRGFITANVHHAIVLFNAWYQVYGMCPEVKDTEWTTFKWFDSETCYKQVHEGSVHNLMIAMSYLVVDYVTMKTFVKDLSKTQQQFLWHHIIAFTGFGANVLAGFGFPAAGNVTLFCEISGFFLNYKEIIEKKEGKNSTLAQINQICFFITYTVFRMFLFPILVYRLYIDVVQFWHLRTRVQQVCSIYAYAMAWLTYILNLYWYGLILKALVKLLQNAGILAKPVEKKKEVEILTTASQSDGSTAEKKKEL